MVRIMIVLAICTIYVSVFAETMTSKNDTLDISKAQYYIKLKNQNSN